MSIELRNKVLDHEQRLQALERAIAEGSKQSARQVTNEFVDADAAPCDRKTLTLPEKRKSA